VGRFPDGRLVSICWTGDVCADGPATGILLHKSLNYISIANIILCKFLKRPQEMRPARSKSELTKMRKIVLEPSINISLKWISTKKTPVLLFKIKKSHSGQQKHNLLPTFAKDWIYNPLKNRIAFFYNPNWALPHQTSTNIVHRNKSKIWINQHKSHN